MPAGARLLHISGHDKKSPPPPAKKSAGYIADPDVEAIERSLEWLPEFKVSRLAQFGKTAFANYLTTAAGEKSRLVLEYENNSPAEIVDGANYKFVYERQSGVRPNFKYEILAPSVYIWRKSGKNSFIYESNDPEGRIILDLTLEKLK